MFMMRFRHTNFLKEKKPPFQCTFCPLFTARTKDLGVQEVIQEVGQVPQLPGQGLYHVCQVSGLAQIWGGGPTETGLQFENMSKPL